MNNFFEYFIASFVIIFFAVIFLIYIGAQIGLPTDKIYNAFPSWVKSIWIICGSICILIEIFIVIEDKKRNK